MVKLKTRQSYESCYRCHLEPRFAGRRIDHLKRSELNGVIAGLTKNGNRATARTVGKVLKSLYGHAITHGLIEEDANPSERLTIPTDGPGRDRVLSDDELRLVWLAAAKLDLRRSAFVRLLILTGCRKGEVESAAPNQLDGARWTIPAAKTKTSNAHVLPLPPIALDIFTSVFDLGLRFGTSMGHQTTKLALDRAMLELLCEEQGVEIEEITIDRSAADQLAERFNLVPWVLHDIRRTFATGLSVQRAPFDVIEALLNHVGKSRAGVAGLYQRFDRLEPKATALVAWSEHVRKITGTNVLPLRRAG